jgi:molybdate-binding protein
MKCLNDCRKSKQTCSQNDCRHWIDYSEDFNCSIHTADINGPMTLDEVSKRLGLSLVRVKQIEEAALVKLRKRNSGLISDLLHE